MTIRVKSVTVLLAASVALSACGRSGSEQSPLERLNASAVTAPDEFKVLPRKPLELPDDLAALPAPAPGQGNRTDLTPIRDLEVALSGREGRSAATGSDAAVVRAASANGITPGIRDILAAEDEEWRRNNKGRLLERLLLRNQEGITYRAMILDARAELRRMRALGVRVPQLPEE